jgi:hypothetical protein
MPTTRYEIYVKGLLSFVKFTKQEFDKVCSDLDKLKVNYATNIVDLI